MQPRPLDRDIGFILMEANRYLRKDKTVSTSDVRAAWSGIRPLVADPSKQHGDTKSVSRSHVVEVSEKGKLVTIAGGKWTTYRLMAEDTVDRLLHDIPECALGRALKECETAGMGIIGSDRAGKFFAIRSSLLWVTFAGLLIRLNVDLCCILSHAKNNTYQV